MLPLSPAAEDAGRVAPVLLSSPLLASLPGVRHGFSTRRGGVSLAPFAELNLGFSVGDDPARVEANRTRFIAAGGFGPLAEVHQVHGATVVSADSAGAEADALFCAGPGVAVAVRTADCAPVLLAALDHRGQPGAVAAVHAGWRGACSGVVEAAVGALVAAGFEPSRMRAAIGPAIGPERFEVGPEVVAAAELHLDGDAGPGRFSVGLARPGPGGRPHLDLPELVRRCLLRAGLEPGNVDALGRCTASDPDLFFSHRRDGGRTGRHLAAIELLG